MTEKNDSKSRSLATTPVLGQAPGILVGAFLALVLTIGIAEAEEIRSATAFFDDSFGDLQEEAATAVEEGKTGVLIMFETDDCPWCKRMKEQVLNRVSVQDHYHENFRILSVNVDGDTTIVNFDGKEIVEKDFALKYLRIRATPVFVFFDHRGKLLTRYTGVVKSVKEFLLLADYVVGGHYENGRFSKFRRQQLAAGTG